MSTIKSYHNVTRDCARVQLVLISRLPVELRALPKYELVQQGHIPSIKTLFFEVANGLRDEELDIFHEQARES